MAKIARVGESKLRRLLQCMQSSLVGVLFVRISILFYVMLLLQLCGGELMQLGFDVPANSPLNDGHCSRTR